MKKLPNIKKFVVKCAKCATNCIINFGLPAVTFSRIISKYLLNRSTFKLFDKKYTVKDFCSDSIKELKEADNFLRIQAIAGVAGITFAFVRHPFIMTVSGIIPVLVYTYIKNKVENITSQYTAEDGSSTVNYDCGENGFINVEYATC